MKITVAIIFFLFSQSSFADERYWQTELTLLNNKKIELYWINGYCAPDILYKIKAGQHIFKLTGKSGHPIFNLDYNLIALYHCEEGRCNSTIQLLDLNDMQFLHPIELNFENYSIAINGQWNGKKLTIDVLNYPNHKINYSCDKDMYNDTLTPIPKDRSAVKPHYEFTIKRKERTEPPRKIRTLKGELLNTDYLTDLRDLFELKYSASSTLKTQNSLTYSADHIGDSDITTAWIEGTQGFGIHQKIEIQLSKDKFYEATGSYRRDVPLKTIQFANGYGKNKNIWKKNARVKHLILYINQEKRFYIDLIDTISPQIIQIPSVELLLLDVHDKISFEIEEVYSGSFYQDTSISEIHFFTE